MILKEQIIEIINEKINGSHLFLIDVKVLPGNKIEVFVDGDNGLGINECVDLSRHIEKSLDREVEDFSLEVSSPGATQPLKLSRQYIKHVGRDLELKLNDGTTASGTLLEIGSDGNLVIETTTREPKPIGKGKINVTRTHNIQLENIKETKIKLKF
ncbi:MAG: ribosome assembly cofactor RimP [Sphingobacteriaceae bacterium]|nr:ribosome assembly cofactor RimP [Sphingobacteriaceae bacterium]